MKHFYRTTSVILFLSLMFSLGTRVQAQDIPQVEPNSDGTYNVETVVETFKLYVDGIENLPTTDEEINNIIREFLFKMGEDEYYGGKTYRFGDENAEKLTDTDIEFQIDKPCLDYVKQTIEQRAKASSAAQPNEKAMPQKRDLPMTYQQLAKKIGIPVGIVLVLAVIVILLAKSRKKKKAKEVAVIDHPTVNLGPVGSNNGNGTSDVIIRRKTSSVLHKQCLDDVFKDPNYMTVDCSAFCDDTAVKKMYIKNSVILDIYNRYAEDLRNPNNPKED